MVKTMSDSKALLHYQNKTEEMVAGTLQALERLEKYNHVQKDSWIEDIILQLQQTVFGDFVPGEKVCFPKNNTCFGTAEIVCSGEEKGTFWVKTDEGRKVLLPGYQLQKS